MAVPRRLLFAAAGGHGHLQPLLPLARAARAAGHEVLVTGAASLGPHVARRGLSYAATGPDLTPLSAPLAVHDLDEERAAVGSWFVARLGRARAADVLALCRAWRPDVVVRDEVDFGAAVAAEAAGAPHVAVVVIGAGGFILPDVVRDPLDALAAELGLREQDTVAMLHRHLTLTPFPPSFRDPRDPLPGDVMAYQVPVEARGGGQDRTVYVTLGTIFNTESGDLLRTAALGAAACPGVDRIVVATGEHVDPAGLGQVPEGVTVQRFVEQDEVLAACVGLVSHAGSGAVLGGLRNALPTVSLPMGADQLLNAQRLQELGLGVALRADVATADDVAAALEQVLASTAVRRRAEAVRDEIRALPDLQDALRAVEALVP